MRLEGIFCSILSTSFRLLDTDFLGLHECDWTPFSFSLDEAETRTNLISGTGLFTEGLKSFLPCTLVSFNINN